MSGVVEVPRCVLARRLIAAADVAARKTESEVDPACAGLQTLLAAVRRAWFDSTNLPEMLAARRHGA